jgi:hypothetical protein
MGGHGALTIALKQPTAYRSVSAFAPICNPTQVPWGQKAFAGYLGEGWQQAAAQYDATELVRGYIGPQLPVLMDNGTDDEFLQAQVGGRCLPADCLPARCLPGVCLQAAQCCISPGPCNAACIQQQRCIASATASHLETGPPFSHPYHRSCTLAHLKRQRPASCS